jgi:acyl transferase domain-containing protein
MDSRGDQDEAIAIVGIACQFPGARDPAELHHLTMAGGQMFRPVPGLPGWAALLDGQPVQFGEVPDPGPVHKLATETAAQALSDGGRGRHGGGPLETGQRTGLIIASTVSDLCEVARDGFRIGQETRFPPAAYRDSLHAIAAACDALSTGELDVVIAGGAGLGVDPGWIAQRAAGGDLATDEMRIYDADPAGTLPGDGSGVIVLMRSADARAEGLPAYAQVAGWAVAQRPDTAYVQAGLDPGDVSLVEGYGSGTASGDLAELIELARLRHGSAASAALGAVSANIGQAGPAAGVASLIKVIVAMVAGAIPPATGSVRPHELIESGTAGLRLPAAAEPWPEGVRLAAVNSLGPDGRAAGGVHLVLRREVDQGRGRGRRRRATPPLPPPRPASPGKHSAAGDVSAEPQPETTAQISERTMPATIFALCGTEPAAVAATLDVVAKSADELAGNDLRDLARQLAAAAQRAADRGAPLRVTVTATGPRQLSGQASHAARLLRHWPADNRQATTLTGQGVSIGDAATGTVAVVFPGLATTVTEHTTLLAASLNAMRLLDRLGVAADSAVGYGFGELAGLVWAGCLPAAEAARLAALRGRTLRACSTRPAALVRVDCDSSQAAMLCAAGRAKVAVYESAGSCVLAGPSTDVRDLIRRASALGIPATLLDDGAQRWAATSRCTAPLRGVLADIVFGTPRRRLISTITGLPVTPADDIAELLAGQPSKPVLFAQALALAVRRPGHPPADLVLVAGPEADPANPAGAPTPGSSGTGTLAAIVTAACGLPAVTLPTVALPAAPRHVPTAPTARSSGTVGAIGTMEARVIAALFTVGALKDLTPYVRPEPSQAAWTVPLMRDASTTETGTTVSSSLMGKLPGLLPVGAQRHPGRSVRVQFDTEHLVQLDLVLIEAEP